MSYVTTEMAGHVSICVQVLNHAEGALQPFTVALIPVQGMLNMITVFYLSETNILLNICYIKSRSLNQLHTIQVHEHFVSIARIIINSFKASQKYYEQTLRG